LKETEKKLAGVCGIYCGVCPHIGKLCQGCLDPKNRIFIMQDCPIYNCCKEKELEHCGLCSSYPCEKTMDLLEMEKYVKETEPDLIYGWTLEMLIRNAERRKKVGTEKWLEEQKQKLR
jgi:hypothetical protein